MFKKILIVSTLVLTSLTTVTSVLSTRAEAQAVKGEQISIVLKKVNRDSSRVYTINNQEVLVTKAQLDEVAKVVKANNIKEPKVGDMKLGRASALPWVGGTAALVGFIMKVANIGWWGMRALSQRCVMNMDGCVRLAIGLGNGARWAHDQARNWAIR